MRFHVITIFPEFFEVLHLSLLGKAVDKGVLNCEISNLRDYATDKHRTVDDTPYGGGPGMVMRADIWGKAIDAALEPSGQRRILAIPTPSGQPLTQAKVRDLATASDIIIACGRYEGIDARVAQHYRETEHLEVFEYSLGDYVLNGGEVAALALIEAVGRLHDGTVGNPQSLVEESHEGAGLLEYPVYTRPEIWRGAQVPAVLREGNHARIEAWRDNRAIERTALYRPDLLSRLDARFLSKAQRERLAALGWVYRPQPTRVVIRKPHPDEALALSGLGSDTFSLACPDYLSERDIAQFVAEEFDLERVKARLDDPEHHRYLVAEIGNELVGYTYCVVGMNEAQCIEAGIMSGDVYLSKCYVREAFHGLGLSGALLEAALEGMEAPVSLGTSIHNKRAQKFYRRHGFKKVGTRTFTVGNVENRDIVMRREFPLETLDVAQ